MTNPDMAELAALARTDGHESLEFWWHFNYGERTRRQTEARVARMRRVMLSLDGFAPAEVARFLGCSREAVHASLRTEPGRNVAQILIALRQQLGTCP